MATVNVAITQKIILYILEQYYLKYHEFNVKTEKNLKYMVCFCNKVCKINKYTSMYSNMTCKF